MPAGFLDRVSVFETLRAYRGRVFHAAEHLRRLSESCAAMGRALPFEKEALRRWLDASLAESGFADAVLRFSVHWTAPEEGALVLFVRPFRTHPEEWYRKGVSLRSAVQRRPSFRAQDPQIKSSATVGGVLAMLDKGELPAHELLLFGPGGTVAEGTVSNIFVVKQKTLLTPSVGSGILKGVTRARVMQLAKKRAWPVVETPLTRHDVYTADECFITNTSSEVLPVVEVDGRRIGAGSPGPMTRILSEDFKKNRR